MKVKSVVRDRTTFQYLAKSGMINSLDSIPKFICFIFSRKASFEI